MRLGNIAFNSPSPINIDDSAKIELRLDLHQSPAELAKSITAPGKVESDRIKVSDHMTAHLSSPDFDITANTPETQAVSGAEPTSWIWTVKPKTSGEHNLYLDLDANIILDGVLTPRTIRTFSKTINVTVTPSQRFVDFAKENWQWLWATIFVPIAGWWWRRRHKSANVDVT
ncbi:hypothetical protein [Paraburkholderia sp. BL17N1]|uniref:hypothetical protein n=1 Tax=Paraburkholderia sp. BL17N1 TaxID=1938798 RepID=UPI000F101596|nr:hypothetical protein [Paraburkholderia sp. BL17N1]RKR45921.1 hypothetical protein B0G82_3586 [Paraburkholderia sp. BL17N1]